MTLPRTLKQKITETVLAAIPSSHKLYRELTLDEVVFRWWFTGRQDGLRLTDEGVVAFELADIEYYVHEFKHEKQSYHKFILDLNKKIQCPYYIGRNKNKTHYLRLYDGKIAMVLNLYGNLDEYLNSIKVKK